PQEFVVCPTPRAAGFALVLAKVIAFGCHAPPQFAIGQGSQARSHTFFGHVVPPIVVSSEGRNMNARASPFSAYILRSATIPAGASPAELGGGETSSEPAFSNRLSSRDMLREGRAMENARDPGAAG